MFDYESALPHWVNRLSFLLRSEAQRRLREAGFDLSAEEWALLMVLWRDAPQPMAALARATLRDRTTVTRTVDRLVAKGLLERTSDERDRRSVLVGVTRAGRAIEGRVTAAITPLVAEAGAGVSRADAATALAVLRRMVDNLDPTDPPAGGAR